MGRCACAAAISLEIGFNLVSDDPKLRNPITGMVACCARATSGHAAAPPTSEMNSRRLMGSP